ncbi:MAG: hypothetical protein WDM81_03590 [Rhizomicrobium sp.]
MASSVELEPAPAMTGTRPLASSTQISITRMCSSWLSVGDSPVVPQGTRPWLPCAICQDTSLRERGLVHRAAAQGRDEAGIEPFDAFARERLDGLPFDRGRNYRAARPRRQGGNCYEPQGAG